MLRGLTLLALAGCSAPCLPPPAAGAAGWIEGERYPIARSWVYAEDNANQRWSAMLESVRAYPLEFQGDLRETWVEIGDTRRAVDGIGGSPQGTYFHVVTDREGARELATALGVPAGARTDPGIALEAALTVLRDPAPLGEPVIARFTLTNAGAAPIAFTSRSGIAGPERDTDFSVAITRSGAALPLLPAPSDLGGLRRSIELAPGQSVNFELDLAAWASLSAPGRHHARVRYGLVVEPPESFKSPAYAKAHQLWDAEVAAACDWTIE